jgi:3-oxoacyl-[acyl-carrier protein] reductase
MSTEAGHKVVLITGANGGLGRALVQEFSAQGWQVVAASRTPIQATEPRIFPVQLDVTNQEQIEHVTEEVLGKFSRLDVLINNAGVTADALISQITDDDWNLVLETNLNGAFRCCRAVARQMMRQRDGHIINISSHSALRGPRGQTNYASAKAGMVGLTQSLAKELGPRNVRVNAIFPGVMPTPMTAQMSEEIITAFARANALGRINAVDEVARFIAFLATTQNISGQVFALDSRITPWV